MHLFIVIAVICSDSMHFVVPASCVFIMSLSIVLHILAKIVIVVQCSQPHGVIILQCFGHLVICVVCAQLEGIALKNTINYYERE